MTDETEALRKQRIAELQLDADIREGLEKRYGKVWSTNEMTEDFTCIGFMAPYVVVRRKSDGVKGSLEFQHQPRFYFNCHIHRY